MDTELQRPLSFRLSRRGERNNQHPYATDMQILIVLMQMMEVVFFLLGGCLKIIPSRSCGSKALFDWFLSQAFYGCWLFLLDYYFMFFLANLRFLSFQVWFHSSFWPMFTLVYLYIFLHLDLSNWLPVTLWIHTS